MVAQEDNEFDFQVEGTIWEGQMSSGRQIELYLGLGDNLDRRFRGFIDTVRYRDGQGTIELSCRGRPSLLIDRRIGEKVTFGESMTYKEVVASLLTLAGLSEEESHQLRRDSLHADVFLTSTNALTMDGKLVNIDGTGDVFLFVGYINSCNLCNIHAMKGLNSSKTAKLSFGSLSHC